MTQDSMTSLVQSIDARRAEAYHAADRERIHAQICAKHGDLDTFSDKLKLHLMLSPLSYKADVDKLWVRARDTQWRFEPVLDWTRDRYGTRVLVIPAGSGAGKSTISAALLSHGLTKDLIAAHHFFKYNDQRRLDMVAHVKSMAHQLAVK